VREGDIAAGLAEVQARYETIDIGSYPYFRDTVAGVAIVAKGTDVQKADQAIGEVASLFRSLGAEPTAGEPA
jgi:molybdopterin-biosynthesis enzyme MoeA-like protein